MRYELLKPGQTITRDVYRQQLIHLKRTLAEKRPEYTTRHESNIFHHDNARPLVAVPVKKSIWNKVLAYLSCPLRSMQNVLIGIRFNSEQDIKNGLDLWLRKMIRKREGKRNVRRESWKDEIIQKQK